MPQQQCVHPVVIILLNYPCLKTNILSKVIGRGPRTCMQKLLIIFNSRLIENLKLCSKSLRGC